MDACVLLSTIGSKLTTGELLAFCSFILSCIAILISTNRLRVAEHSPWADILVSAIKQELEDVEKESHIFKKLYSPHKSIENKKQAREELKQQRETGMKNLERLKDLDSRFQVTIKMRGGLALIESEFQSNNELVPIEKFNDKLHKKYDKKVSEYRKQLITLAKEVHKVPSPFVAFVSCPLKRILK